MTYIEMPKFEYRVEWLKWRSQGIGASDASIIMGVSRFKTREKLLQEKAIEEIKEQSSYIMQRGNEIEFQVRMFLEKEFDAGFPPNNICSKILPFIRASLDGHSKGTNRIVEIKLLASIKHDNHVTEGTEKWEKVKQGWVPDEYWPQVQLQLWVSGAESCLFVAYKESKGNRIITSDKLAIVEVKPDKDYQKEMLKKLFDFWLDVIYLKETLQYRNELD